MDENLVGYLLDALDPEERRAVDSHLRADPEARQRLQRLRALMQPLAADLDPVEPPAGLWVRALGRVAEYSCRSLPSVPTAPAPAVRAPAPARSWWRRADLLVAACLLLCVTLLIPPGLYYLQYQRNKLACQENLHQLYTALAGYSERHGGYLPNVATAATPPRNVAGMYAVILQENGLLPGQAQVNCPPQGSVPPPASRFEMDAMPPDAFRRCAAQMRVGCYAYSLGYEDDWGVVQGLRRTDADRFVPILADRPPEDVAQGGKGNSPNHAGRGQNVLFLDGHVLFCTSRTVGINGDDIYVNYDGKVAAGKCREDTVLGAGDARP